MEVRWDWLLWLLILVVVAGLVLWVRPWRKGRMPQHGVLVAHTERLRRTPRFQTLLRRQLVVTLLRTSAVLLLLAGTTLLSARLVSVTTDQPEVNNRDIMLCLDVSGSMTTYDAEVVKEFNSIVSGLDGERIGLTIWNGTAVTVFPLTDDYAFVTDQLDEAYEAFTNFDYDYIAGTSVDFEHASQVGDGLVSCVQRFDRPQDQRGRAVVLATDNDVQGPPVYELPEAADFAAEEDVVVYGLGTPLMTIEDKAEFEQAAETTGGQMQVMGVDGSTESIVAGIEGLETARIKKPPQPLRLDEPATGAALMGFGVLLLVASGFRRLEGSSRRSGRAGGAA